MRDLAKIVNPPASFAVLLLAMLLAACPPKLLGIPVPTLDLDRLIADSNVIVVGEVIDLKPGPTAQLTVGAERLTGRRVIGLIRVERILKGSPALTEVPFAYVVPPIFLGWRSVALHQFAMFFLTSNAENHYQFTSPYYPFVAASRGTSASSGDAVERVTSTLGAAASAPGTDAARLYAVRTLSYSKSIAATRQLQRLLSSESLAVQVEAGAELLRRNDLSGLDTVVAALLESPSSVPESVDQDALAAISWGLATRNAVPQVSELLASNDPEVRRAATTSLMRTKAPAAITPLLSSLRDSDFETRYFAAVGLADITAQPAWRPSMDQFRTDENRYLQHWKEWEAAQNQKH